MERGVEQDARGACDDAEPGFGEPSRDVFGEAGTEGQDAVPVSDFHPEGRNVDFGAEFHRGKSTNFISLPYDPACKLQK